MNGERYRFVPQEKRPKVCYLTRKERSAAWLHSVLYAKGKPFTEFEWMPLRELSEDEYARNLREASVYVSTNMQEGMNTSVLEAMACGCLVVGYSGIAASTWKAPARPGTASWWETGMCRLSASSWKRRFGGCRRTRKPMRRSLGRTKDGGGLPESRRRGGQPAVVYAPLVAATG